MTRTSGFALITVMIAVLVLSAVAVGLAMSVQTEARIQRTNFDAVQAEQLAQSGQEFAAFLTARGLTGAPDFLAGLPFEVVDRGFHYRAQTPSGSVDIYFEADNGKLNLNVAPPEVMRNFFALWTGDRPRAELMTAAIEDWRDADSDVRPNGAEAVSYAPLGFSPRNGQIGIADLPLIRGLDMTDFTLSAISNATQTTIRPSIDSYFTAAGTGAAINANFAPELILRAIPGIDDSFAAAIVAARRERLFENANDLQARSGLGPDSPAWPYLTFSRIAPATRTVARVNSNGLMRSERRVAYAFTVTNFLTGGLDTASAIGRRETDLFANSAGP